MTNVAAPNVGLLRFLAQLGHVLLSTGENVAVIEDTLRRIAVAHGAQRVSVVALPTALFVKFDEGDITKVDFSSDEGLSLRFDQIEAVFALAQQAHAVPVTPSEGLARLDAILTAPAKFGPVWTVTGHVFVTVGIALVLQPTLGVIASATGFGLAVGALKLFARNRGMLQTLLPTVSAFVVTALAIEAAKYGFPASPLSVAIASLVTFLPGGILAIATMELAFGDVVSGASRFVMGLLQLVFLILGMMIAASLVGLPPDKVFGPDSSGQLMSWAPWLGVALFGIGHVLHYSAPLATLPWLFIVLFVAHTGQQVGNAAFGGYMSGFVGALIVTPLTYFIQYRLNGPSSIVLFLPALWLLVPGSLGLVGLVELVGDNHLAGVQDFVATLFSIVAIALGSLIGAGLYNSLVDPIFRRAGGLAASVMHLRWLRATSHKDNSHQK